MAPVHREPRRLRDGLAVRPHSPLSLISSLPHWMLLKPLNKTHCDVDIKSRKSDPENIPQAGEGAGAALRDASNQTDAHMSTNHWGCVGWLVHSCPELLTSKYVHTECGFPRRIMQWNWKYQTTYNLHSVHISPGIKSKLRGKLYYLRLSHAGQGILFVVSSS